MMSEKKDLTKMKKEDTFLDSTFAARIFRENIPKYALDQTGLPARAAYEIIHQELDLDGNPALNLASFVTTWMEDEANRLIEENLGKNFIDIDEYPETFQVQEKCINILARLFNSPDDADSIGTATVGSSEAIMLGLLAHKWTWKLRRQKEGKPADKPNIVMGADVHTVWEKFALYFDVELRLIPLDDESFTVTAEEIAKKIDENTICVGAVIGTTYTGQMDPIEAINDELLKIKKEKGWDIPIHVDAASGGFIAPFIYPDLKWDFRLEQVKSINVSGHKYGLVYPGIGWLVMKDKSDLPKDLIFDVNYLGGVMPNYSINFSKGSYSIIAQYYNFLRLGRDGYTSIMKNIMKNAKYLADSLVETGKFELLDKNLKFPIVTLILKDSKFSAYQLSDLLRSKGWIVPAYTLPPNAENIEVLRVVIKENFGRSMVNNFIADVKQAIEELDASDIKRDDNPRDHSLLY